MESPRRDRNKIAKTSGACFTRRLYTKSMEAGFIKFGLGVGVLLLATHAFVLLAKKISGILKLSPLVIGTTIVALGTSLPELAVSVVSIAQGDAGLAWGNIIGSNIVNVLFVLPVGIILGKLRIGTIKTQRNVWILLGAMVMFVAMQFSGLPGIYTGLALLAGAVVVTAEEYLWGVWGRKHEDGAMLRKLHTGRLRKRDGVGLVVAIGGIAMGGILIVSSVEGISQMTGVSTTILGLSLTAIATSLPELFTTIFGQEEHQAKITVGNIVGSNIYNLLLIGGVISLFTSVRQIARLDWVWLIAATGLLGWVLHRYKGQSVPRWVGGGLLVLFFGYLWTLSK